MNEEFIKVNIDFDKAPKNEDGIAELSIDAFFAAEREQKRLNMTREEFLEWRIEQLEKSQERIWQRLYQTYKKVFPETT